MDAEWVNHGGILAEAISFLMIAPEIIGIERIRRAEDGLEDLFRHRGSDTLIIGQQEPPFMPWVYADEPGWLLPVSALAGAIAVMMVLFAAAFTILGLDAVFWIGSVGLASLLIMVGAYFVTERRKPRGLAVIAYLLVMPLVAMTWISVGVAKGIHILLGVLIAAATRLLRGPERLRVLVFSTGVLLLFGGMAAQFVGTF